MFVVASPPFLEQIVYKFLICSIVSHKTFFQSYLSVYTSSCKIRIVEYPFSLAHFSLNLSLAIWVSGDFQFITCLKCCAPSNSIIILQSGIQKSNGRQNVLLHHSCLNCFIIFGKIGNKNSYNFLSVLFLHKEHHLAKPSIIFWMSPFGRHPKNWN